jgi:hypothetical protein
MLGGDCSRGKDNQELGTILQGAVDALVPISARWNIPLIQPNRYTSDFQLRCKAEDKTLVLTGITYENVVAHAVAC